MRVLSLGWGVQSFTLAAMIALGELPPVDAVIHSDTKFESILTYRFAEMWTSWLEYYGVRVVTVRDENNKVVTDRVGGKIFIPAFTNTPSSKGGQLRRQCTQRWKIAPLRRWLQKNRNGERVDMLIGISTDEWRRMRDSNVKYISNVYPLVDLGISRKDCKIWLGNHYLEEPPKSACTFCPYHSTSEWMRIKQTPEDYKEAINLDNRIRKVRPPYDLFIHPSRRPLEEIDFRTPEEQGQMSLWDNECSGICGV